MKQKMIIIPGWGGTELLWEYQKGLLGGLFDVVVRMFPYQDRVEKMVDALFEKVGEKVILCGHSLGGWVAILGAIRYPERVSHLILIGSWSGELDNDKRAYFERWRSEIKEGHLERLLMEINRESVSPSRQSDLTLMGILRKGQSLFPKEGFLNQTNAILESRPLFSDLRKIRCPTLILYGREDSAFSVETEENLANAIPLAQLKIIEECGHMPHLERPELVASLIQSWVVDL